MLTEATDLTGVSGVQTTSATALTGKTITVLAAPGAGLRYRIYSWSLAYDMTATGAVPAGIVNALSGLLGCGLAISVQQPSASFGWPQGNHTNTNTAFTLAVYPSIAVVGGIPIVVLASYAIEAV